MRKRGITLIELMVTVLLFSVLSSAAYIALEVGRRSMRVGGVEIELQQGARKAMTEMLRELRETDVGTVTIYTYTDVQNNERHQAIAFASPRGNASSSKEGTCGDDVTNNACFHITSNGDPAWRSLVVYAVYQTSDGRNELRRYVGYNSAYASGYFPFTFTGITSTQINVSGANSVNISLNRDGVTSGIAPRVVAQNVVTEDANNNYVRDPNEDDGSASLPFDNNDGVLNHGVDFSLNDPLLFVRRTITISLFLRKRDTAVSSADRFIVSTLEGMAELRK